MCSCFLHRSVYSDELLVRRWTKLAVGSTTSALPTFYSNRKASIRLTFDNGDLTRRTLIGSIKIELFCQQKSLINGISYRSVETIHRRLQSNIFLNINLDRSFTFITYFLNIEILVPGTVGVGCKSNSAW